MTVDIPESSEDLELFHHGIKGMKWGVRRKEGPDGTVSSRVKGKGAIKVDNEDGSSSYVPIKRREVKMNPDGTVRAASKKAEKAMQDRVDNRPSTDARNASKLKGKPVSALSNKELQEVNTRLNLEQNYANLTKKPSTMQKGIKYTQTGLTVIGLATAAYKLKDNEVVKLGARVIKNSLLSSDAAGGDSLLRKLDGI